MFPWNWALRASIRRAVCGSIILLDKHLRQKKELLSARMGPRPGSGPGGRKPGLWRTANEGAAGVKAEVGRETRLALSVSLSLARARPALCLDHLLLPQAHPETLAATALHQDRPPQLFPQLLPQFRVIQAPPCNHDVPEQRASARVGKAIEDQPESLCHSQVQLRLLLLLQGEGLEQLDVGGIDRRQGLAGVPRIGGWGR